MEVIKSYFCPMAKYVLNDTSGFDFLLFGICCHAKDYKLCWSINNAFNLQLEKEEKDLEVISGKQKMNFSLYQFSDTESHATYSLLSNKDKLGYLIPEQKHTDYFMMVQNSFDDDPAEMLEKLRSMDVVLTAFPLEVSSLKSKSNLLF